MKSYTFQFPFQGNRKGDIVTEDKYGQLLVKSCERNVRWTPKEISRLTSMGMLRENNPECTHSGARVEGDELFCIKCNKRWEANEQG
jgi:hypothetical protein